jgi:hypothetical protein
MHLFFHVQGQHHEEDIILNSTGNSSESRSVVSFSANFPCANLN